MIVRDVRVAAEGAAPELSAEVEAAGESPQRLWMRFPGLEPERLRAVGDPFLAAVLPLAMARGEDLEIEAPVSARLLGASGRIAETLARFAPAWRMRLRAVEVTAPSEPREPGEGGVGLFFSGGVDSFFSLLREPGRPTHLVLVHGFDIDLDNAQLFDEAAATLRAVAAETGSTPLTVATNIRELSDPHVHWELFHGPALGSVGLALGGVLGTCLVPSGYPLTHLRPWGTHPELDPLWSTEATQFVHDGAEVPRLDKLLDTISRSPLALDHLRVCWRQEPGRLNCGRCEKCLMVMSALQAAGALERARTLPDRVDPEAIRGTDLSMRLPFLEELIARLEDGELRDALEGAVRRGRRRAAVRRVVPGVLRR